MLPDPSSTMFRPSQIGPDMWPPFFCCTTGADVRARVPRLSPVGRSLPLLAGADAFDDGVEAELDEFVGAGVRDDRVVVLHTGLLTLHRPEAVLHAHHTEHERVVRGLRELGVVGVETRTAKDLDPARVVLPDRGRERAFEQERAETRIFREPVEEIERTQLQLLVPRNVALLT